VTRLGHGADREYAHAGQDHEYVDSFFSRSLGEEEPYPALEQEITAPVCVIGGGLAGLTTALGLAERGVKNPVVLEANRLGWGASGRNGGFISLGYSLGPMALIKKEGESQAKELYELTATAMKLIHERIKGVEDEICHTEKGILRISWFDEEEEVREYVEKMDRIFDDKLEFWPRKKIREHYLTDRYYDAYLKPRGLLTHCLKFTCQMGSLAAENGARIFEKSPVLEVRRRGSQWHVKTRYGSTCILS
jgi:gamma-glutamylputrescine oxidase